MKLEQAARQALEALENGKTWIDIITPLREALAEQAQQKIDDGVMLTSMLHPHNCCVLVDDISEDSIEQVERAEQEPVAWGMRASNGAFFTITPEEHDNNGEGLHNIPLYTAPVRTKDLTYAELGELFVKAKEETFGYARVKPEGGISLKPSIEYFARAVIAADREKNK